MQGEEQLQVGTVIHCINLADARLHERRQYPLERFESASLTISGLNPDVVVSKIRRRWPEDSDCGRRMKVYKLDRNVYVTLGTDEWAKVELMRALGLL